MTVLEVLRGRLRLEMAARAEALCSGAATDHADYRHKVGVLDGIGLALRELVELEAATDQDD